MALAVKKGLDKEDIFSRIKEINESAVKNNQSFTINLTSLAEEFGVKTPTIKYYVDWFEQNDWLEKTDEMGERRRKKYRIKQKPFLHSEKNEEEIDQFLRDVMTKEEEKTQENKAKTNDNFNYAIIKKPLPKEGLKPLTKEDLYNKNAFKNETAKRKRNEYFHQYETNKDFSKLELNEKIETFIQNSKKLANSEDLLTQEDKEILSVINETIHQAKLYLNDLSDELSTVQNKELIKHLIDNKEKQDEELNRLRAENEKLKKQTSSEPQQHVDPERIRFMQQMVVGTVDAFVEMPNHAMALQRKEFRKNIVKEINDLADYAIGLEE